MRPTFMGFETTKRGLMVNQKAMDIVGNNVANLGVTGYTRQRVDQVSISSHGMSSRYGINKAMLAGQGADIKGVAQLRDPYLDKRFRQENSDVGFYNKTVEVMTDLEDSLDEWSSNGLKDAIAKISKAITDLSGDINSTNANVVRTRFKSMVQVLRQFDTKLNNIADQQKYDLEINVNSVNSLVSRIADLNQAIAKDTYGKEGATGTYFAPNELMDQRNVLLDELSGYGDIQITTNPDCTVDVSMGGQPVVKGDWSETLSYVKNLDNTVSLNWQSDGSRADLMSGSMMASINMINGRGPAATGNENAERGIPFYKDQIDNFAVTLANTYNNVIPVLDADGNQEVGADGKPVFKTLFEFEDFTKEGAGSLNISEAWNESADYLMIENNPEGQDANKYYLKMGELLTAQLKFGDNFTGTFEEYVKDYGGTLQEDREFNISRQTATMTIADTVLDNIAQISGVSMDEEGADMMAYNKAYSAISRIMTAMDEALDTLINRTGRVGL